MDKSISENLAVGDIVTFGSYPQDLVTDKSVVKEIDKLCRKWSSWKKFDYLLGKGRFADCEIQGKRYRSTVVTIRKRMSRLLYEGFDYKDRKKYSFEYKPIEWQVLSINDGKALLVTKKGIDTHEFFVGKFKRNIDGKTIYQNNYKHSAIRQWLNSTFYDMAFSDEEKSIIELTQVKNDASTTKKNVNEYACEDTLDRVFLLSFQEAKTLFADNKARRKKATEYTKAQGCFVYRTEDEKYNNSLWWLRSPDSNYCDIVRCVGYGGGMSDGGFSIAQEPADDLISVAPVIVVRLK